MTATLEKPKPTKAIARKIVELLSYGLVKGKGKPEPGKMCVEAAVCFAMGLPHGDEPNCVGEAVRAFKIQLNDCSWPSNKDRAEGMKGLAIAQLGSDELDQMKFGKLMYLRGTQIILPFVWRKEAANITNAERKAKMLELCEQIEKVKTFKEAETVAKIASASASASAYASAYAYAYAYAYASASAYRHELLKLTAKVGLDVLKEMKSPGCKWLSLLNEK